MYALIVGGVHVKISVCIFARGVYDDLSKRSFWLSLFLPLSVLLSP